MRISCTCGNTEAFSNEMENFEVRLIRFSADSQTGVMRIVCIECGEVTEEMLMGN
jgi:hypothetical protein